MAHWCADCQLVQGLCFIPGVRQHAEQIQGNNTTATACFLKLPGQRGFEPLVGLNLTQVQEFSFRAPEIHLLFVAGCFPQAFREDSYMALSC